MYHSESVSSIEINQIFPGQSMILIMKNLTLFHQTQRYLNYKSIQDHLLVVEGFHLPSVEEKVREENVCF